MATITDIYEALITQITNAIYPNGTAQPSIINTDVTRRPGYPDPNRLDVLLSQGKAHVAVDLVPNMQRNKTRFLLAWETVSIEIATLFLTVSNNQTITVTGSVTAGENCLVCVNAVNYIYTVMAGDTLNSIASALSALIPNASAVNNIITINGAYKISTFIGTQGTAIRELKRQEAIFQVSIYAPTPDTREILGAAIETLLAEPENFYLEFFNDKPARIIWHGTQDYDALQKVLIYKRVINYCIEYATTKKVIYNTVTGLNETVDVSPLIN